MSNKIAVIIKRSWLNFWQIYGQLVYFLNFQSIFSRHKFDRESKKNDVLLYVSTNVLYNGKQHLKHCIKQNNDVTWSSKSKVDSTTKQSWTEKAVITIIMIIHKGWSLFLPLKLIMSLSSLLCWLFNVSTFYWFCLSRASMLKDLISSLPPSSSLVLILLRHFSWLPWRDHVAEIQSRLHEFEAARSSVVVVSFGNEVTIFYSEQTLKNSSTFFLTQLFFL